MSGTFNSIAGHAAAGPAAGAALTEKQIQNAILRYLASLPRVCVWRMNTGAARYGNAKVRFGLPGQADITGISQGVRIEIEVKRPAANGKPAGTQTSEQRVFQLMIERHGGIYVLARSVDDVRRALDERGLL